MSDDRPATCPADAEIASYLADALEPERAEAVREHLAACGDCVERALDARRFVASMAPARRRVPVLRLAAAAAVVLALTAVVWRSTRPDAVVVTTRPAAIAKEPWRPQVDGGLLSRGAAEAGSLEWAMEPYAADDFAAAIDRLRRYLRDNPDDDRARFYLGVALALAGRDDEARDSLRRVAEGRSAQRGRAREILRALGEAEAP